MNLGFSLAVNAWQASSWEGGQRLLRGDLLESWRFALHGGLDAQADHVAYHQGGQGGAASRPRGRISCVEYLVEHIQNENENSTFSLMEREY